MEETLVVHKNEIIFFDEENNCHYRLNPGNIKKITYDHMTLKKFFGLKKELIEIIVFDIEDEDIPEQLIVYEHLAPGFRRYLGSLRSFVDDNKVDLEIKRLDA
jgi:hypothetical protein